MAFDPLDWLGTADLLLAEGSEASLRTAVSRAYYAVWLKSLLSLEHDGLLNRSGSRNDHTAVVRALRVRRATASKMLSELARDREASDYDTEIRVTASAARTSISTAKEVARLLAPDWARLPT